MDLKPSVSSKKAVINAVPLCLPKHREWKENETIIQTEKYQTDMMLCEKGIDVLRRIGDDPVVVISVTGQPKTGKSYLLSQLVDGVKFEVDDSPTSKTEGIWIASSPSVVSRDGVNVRTILLDAESVGSITSTDAGKFWEAKLFGVCFLISSVIMYNTYYLPSEVELQSLNLFSNFSASLFSKMKNNNQELLRKVAPCFFWILRDVTLKLGGTGCNTWKQYLEDNLFSLKGRDHSTSMHTIANNIKKIFPSFDVLSLCPPSVDPDICSDLENPSYREKLAEFIKGINFLKEIILSKLDSRNTHGIDYMLTGNKIADLLQTYVNDVNLAGTCFPKESSWQIVVQSLMQNALNKSEEKFLCSIKKIELPCSTEDLRRKLRLAENDVRIFFEKEMNKLEVNVKEEQNLELEKMLHFNYSLVEKRNEEKSELYCENIGKVLTNKKLSQLFDRHFSKNPAVPLSNPSILKEEIFKEYDETTNGFPCSLEVRKKLAKEVEEETNKISGWKGIDEIIFDIQTFYERSMEQIRSELPCSEEYIRNKHDTLKKKVYRRLDKQTEMLSILQKHTCKSKIGSTLDKILHQVLHLNGEKSEIHCQELTNILIEKERQTIKHSSLFVYLQNNNRQALVEEYQSNAKGPYTIHFQDELEDRIDQLYQETSVPLHVLRQIHPTISYMADQITLSRIRNATDALWHMMGNTYSWFQNIYTASLNILNFLYKVSLMSMLALVFFFLSCYAPTLNFVYPFLMNIITCVALAGLALFLYGLSHSIQS